MAASNFGIFLNGSYGVGKTSTLDRLADHFATAELPFSLFDVDWFHRSWPPAAVDPDNILTEADNIRAVWRNYRQAGPRTPLIAGVMTRPEDLERYEQCFELPLRVVRLTASSTVAQQRLRSRYTHGPQRALTWHLDEHERLARKLDQFATCDLIVDTDDRTPVENAAIIFDSFAPLLHATDRVAHELPGNQRSSSEGWRSRL